MRLSNFSLLFGAAALLVSAAPDGNEDTQTPFTEESTIFNQKKVPPLTELSPNNWEKERKGSKWVIVKHFR